VKAKLRLNALLKAEIAGRLDLWVRTFLRRTYQTTSNGQKKELNAEVHSEALLKTEIDLKHLGIQESKNKQHHRDCQRLREVRRLLGRYGTENLKKPLRCEGIDETHDLQNDLQISRASVSPVLWDPYTSSESHENMH
jgi:hypothetical protein